ncbi:DUF6232 family protein [Streptomyces sp. PDY-4]|uniref:DUF6232 family protein n=1 Tax=Streptomyces sp. PDY-4 TaxID=3376070 RepID=UPI00379C488E
MPLPPRRGKPLELQVHRQILWVGSAAAPLRNVSWVEVFRLKPAWGKAGVYFLLLVIFAFFGPSALVPTPRTGAAVPPRHPDPVHPGRRLRCPALVQEAGAGRRAEQRFQGNPDPADHG